MTWAEVTALIGVLGSIVVAVLAFVNGKRSDANAAMDRMQTQLDEVEERTRKQIEAQDRRGKALEDYAYTLRKTLADNGITVPPWPASLGGHDG